TISSNNQETSFSRSFSSICDAERWLHRLAEKGLGKRDHPYLLSGGVHPLELPPLISISVCDKRTSRRFELPATFT
ncbi:MAG: hypothetical protein ACK5SR_00585, partial [Burkholderiales bacterium]